MFLLKIEGMLIPTNCLEFPAVALGSNQPDRYMHAYGSLKFPVIWGSNQVTFQHGQCFVEGENVDFLFPPLQKTLHNQ